MKEYLKVGEVAALCGCCSKTVRKFADSGAIKSFRNNKGYRIVPFKEALKLQDLLVKGIELKI